MIITNLAKFFICFTVGAVILAIAVGVDLHVNYNDEIMVLRVFLIWAILFGIAGAYVWG